MSIALVQSATGSVGGANASSVTVTTTATGSGNLLVAYVCCLTNSITITPPASWVQVGTSQGFTTGAGTSALFYLENSSSGVTSHVFSFSASVNAAVAFEEWSGIATSSSLDQQVAQQNPHAASAPTGTTAALAGSGELAVWGLSVQAASALTCSSVLNSYSQDLSAAAHSTQVAEALAYLFYNTSVGSAATSSGCTMSGSGGTGNTTILAVFKPVIIPALSTSPTSLSFAATVGGGNPASQNSTLSEINGAATAWTSSISYGSGSGWLGISPSSGSLGASGNQVVAFTCTTGALAAGTYTATVTFTATTGGSQATVGVTFVVSAGGGSPGTWTWDTANNRLIGSGGVNAVLRYDGFNRKDMFVEADFNWSDGGGLFVRWVDANHLYYLVVNDASTSSAQNTLKLFKRISGVSTQLGTTQAINFTRGTYRHIKLDIQGTALTVFFDGAQILSVTDSAISSAGKAGFTAGNKIQALSLRVQPYGDNVNGMSLYTRQRLASTNPQATPQVLDITLSVRDPEIGNGALIPNTSYAYVKNVAEAYDDLASQSTSPHPYMVWIGDDLKLHFKHNMAQPAPFYLATANGNILWAGNPPVVSRPDMKYRNHQIVDGGTDTATFPPIARHGDGFTQTWLMPGNLAQAPVITLNGQAQNIGVQGTDTGKDFYYQIGSNAISQDPSEVPPGQNDTIIFSNLAIQTQVRVIQDNVNGTGAYAGTIGQTQLAAITSDTGIVEDYVSVPGLGRAAAIALNTSLLQQFGRLGRDIPLSTNQWGLIPGMLVGVTIPQNGVINAFPLITKVTISAQPTSDVSNPYVVGGLLYRFDLDTTEGPVIGDWSNLFTKLIAASAGSIR